MTDIPVLVACRVISGTADFLIEIAVPSLCCADVPGDHQVIQHVRRHLADNQQPASILRPDNCAYGT